MRAADYRLAHGPRALEPRLAAHRSQSFDNEPLHGHVSHRRDDLPSDFGRAQISGAAVPLRNPIPTPLGLNSWYDEIEGLGWAGLGVVTWWSRTMRQRLIFANITQQRT